MGRLGHGRPSRGRRRDAGAHARAAPRDGAAAAAPEGRPAGAGVLALQPPHHGLPRAGGVAGARRGRAAVGPRAAPRQPRVRAAAHQARLHHPPPLEHARPARARAGLRRPAGAARRPLARARVRRLRARRARQPAAAAVADRRVRLPRREPRHPPVGVDRAGGDRHAAARLPRRRRGRAAAAARGGDHRAAPRPRPPPGGPGRRAAARARHGHARARGVRQARGAGDGALDGAVAVGRARRAVAEPPRRRQAAARPAVRDARRPAARAGDDGARSTTRPSTATACAGTATGS